MTQTQPEGAYIVSYRDYGRLKWLRRVDDNRKIAIFISHAVAERIAYRLHGGEVHDLNSDPSSMLIAMSK